MPGGVRRLLGRRRVGLATGIVVATFFAAILLAPVPVAAIYYGVPDFIHTNVGAILDDDPALGVVFLFCSGTMIAEQVFLTAGHCTAPLARYMAAGDRIWVGFGQDVFANPNSWYRVVALYTDPQFTLKSDDHHDLGIAILEKAVAGITAAIVAPAGFMDALRSQRQLDGGNFTTVGYGVTEVFGEYGLRKMAQSRFLNLGKVLLRLGQNVHTGYGGACGGDSGGPVFYQGGDEEILVATASSGDASCLGMSSYYRVDTANSSAFLAPFLPAPP